MRADKAGFCFGVKRAIDLAVQAAATGAAATWGSLIHNRQVVDDLAAKGVRATESLADWETGRRLVIRSHGAEPSVYRECAARGISVIDATCPYVRRAQNLAQRAAAAGHTVIVAGDRFHPEVRGILGWAGQGAVVVSDLAEAALLPRYSSAAALAQTTLRRDRFLALVEELRSHANRLVVYDTICGATAERQTAAAAVAESVEVMIVVGGKESANTRELASICEAYTPTYLIETPPELKPEWLRGTLRAGVTAGASTPDWLIEEVCRNMTEFIDDTDVKQEIREDDAETPAESQTAAQDAPEAEDASVAPEAEDAAAAAPHAEENPEGAAVCPETAETEETAETVETPATEENPAAETEETSAGAAADGDQASMMDETGLVQPYRGAIVEGAVVKVTHDEVYLDIAWKSEGVIPLNQLGPSGAEPPQLGDRIKAEVTRVENQEGYTELSRRRLREIEAKDKLVKLFEAKEEVSAKVIDAVKGGLLVDLGMRGFIPASHVQLGYVDDLSKYVGETLRLRIIEFDENKKRLVLSQKVILAEEAEAAKGKLLETLAENEVLKGVVRRLTSFGAFVDIGGVDGLLHISDMSFSRISHPSEIVKIGEEIDVKILKVDRERRRVSLGMKQLKGSPWLQVGEKYPVNSVVTGKVVRIAGFGAFVQLEDGIDALVHISQIAHHRVGKVEEALKVGETITAKVIECRPGDKRISISIKELLPKESAEEQPAAETEPDAAGAEALGFGGEAAAESGFAAAETETEAGVEAEAGTEPETAAENEAGSEAEAGAEGETETEAEAEAECEDGAAGDGGGQSVAGDAGETPAPDPEAGEPDAPEETDG
ncbi:MAG: bifunctional 4-hydroxy-3-methylbut-2-enyl diphosphate reductase/30S ribosomal protein S1 [Gracilibacteraceae bacterium]|nr:bifunctional 4-hydroxy-3-methylbut-2-enyl diphosphate reductase/30S ribosomal protein S1 [Gracilibacteraceae bacterium]